MEVPIRYETYRLSRVVSIYAIVSADYLDGVTTSSDTHTHAHAWELCHCIRGEMRVRQDEACFLLHGGECLLIPPGAEHNVNVIQPDARCFVVSFTCMDSYLAMLRDQIIQTNARQRQQVQAILSELRSAFELEHAQVRVHHFTPSTSSLLGAEQLICCYLEEILIEMLRSLIRQESAQGRHPDLEAAAQSYLAGRVEAYIRANVDKPLSVQQIAAHFHYSRARLGSLYKRASGQTVGQTITQTKLDRAKELLAAGEKSVTEISEELGFSSAQYFSRKFSKEAGCPPSQYAGNLLNTP